eukprot:gene20409-26486_t
MHPSSPRLGLVSVLHDQPAFASSLLLSIDSTTKSKYFGIESKQAFYSTYQEIIKQSKQVVGGLDTVESSLELDDPSRTSKKDHIDDDSSIASWGIPLDNQLDNDVNDNLQTLSLDIDKDLSFDGSDINTVSSYAPHSPRATYIIGLLRSHLPPRASILLRNKFTTELNLAHLGIGDQLAIILAKALPSLPCLEIANFKNNNLTDSGLEAIINSIAGHENLVELDISSNKIDDNAAAALGSYIGRRNCPLRSLKLSDADIEDSECNQFVEHLMLNELDLSKNILGKDENLKAVNPSIITGGVSLANLLRENFCPIKKLNVHWNMIRMEGAAELCDSIRQTKSLMYLDLSYNSIGREGASILGSALLDNKSLVDLILSNNSIDAVGCFTLIVGAREHNSLAFIDLDGNPIGDQGGRILMKLARFHGHRIRFSAQKCDVIVKSDDIILEINEPIGKYQLNLSNPYDRAVASELLDLVASDPTLEFSKFEFSDSKDFNKRSTSLSLIKCRETILQLSSENQAEVDRLTKIVNIASDSEKIEEVFDIFDKDKSGQLDPIEFQRMLYMLGFDSSEEKVTAIMTTLDADGGSEGKSKFHFKKAMGMSYNPLLGMYNGYYVLDLSKPTDRQCLHKLFEESIQINNHRKNIGKWDISQNGNWSCFRNVIVDGKPVHTLLLHDYSPIPKAGKLEFDFVDYSRPNHEIEKPLNDYKFILILISSAIFGSVSKTFVGSYRVELIVSLFSRIVDLHNFNFLLSVLTAEEVACIYIRIGWLCLFNPMRPEGVYRLDLSRWEERQVAKMLIHLSVVEPGINWYDESYTSSHQGKPMPGWTLTKVWYTENGMPKQGILQLRMSSGYFV